MSSIECRNCGTSLPGGAAYCPDCGQSVKEYSRPWLEMARELLVEALDFDGRMFRSIRVLFTRPGFLSLEYINGKRATYTSPVRMYLIISLLFFLVLPLILTPAEFVSSDHKSSVDLYSKGMFVLLPAFALLLKLFYRPFFYMDHLVFSIHLFSASYVVFAAILSIEVLADQYLLVALVQVVFLLFMVGYAIFALHLVYGDSWLKSVLKFLGLLLLFLPALGALIEAASRVS